jgi:hypothetical protein
MNKMFRPMAMHKPATIKLRRQGYDNAWINYNFPTRAKWFLAGWGINKRTIGSIHSRLHHLACHSPEPIQKKWRVTYNNFMIKHFGSAGKSSMRYLNNWSAHSWL